MAFVIDTLLPFVQHRYRNEGYIELPDLSSEDRFYFDLKRDRWMPIRKEKREWYPPLEEPRGPDPEREAVRRYEMLLAAEPNKKHYPKYGGLSLNRVQTALVEAASQGEKGLYIMRTRYKYYGYDCFLENEVFKYLPFANNGGVRKTQILAIDEISKANLSDRKHKYWLKINNNEY